MSSSPQLVEAGGRLELRDLRERIGTSKANATEVVTTLELRGFVLRAGRIAIRRAAIVSLTDLGAELVDRLAARAPRPREGAFAVLDEAEKRSLEAICRKLAA